jgi:hypothetical protein
MPKDPEQEIKRMVEAIVTNLNQRGIKVGGAAVLGIERPYPTSPDKIKDAVEQVLSKRANTQKPAPEPRKQEPQLVKNEENVYDENDNVCLCPNCFNFETFEDILTPLGGKFDYQTVTLLDKKFDIKFHVDAKGRENMMISEHQEAPIENKIDPRWTAEEIQIALNEAIRRKHYTVAQELLNELNNRKKQ